TQHAEVSEATADATKSLRAFELAEEQVNQPSATETEKGYPRPIRVSKSALRIPNLLYTLCLHSESDTERLKTSDVDFENSKLC
ncbi:hypothetical protein Tco_0406822, partial [Tanacetum coccineum]